MTTAEGYQISTREWLDPPGPLRRYRRLVGGLVLLSVVTTAILWFETASARGPFLVGMVSIGVLSVCYLVLWAVDLVAIYIDPDRGPTW